MTFIIILAALMGLILVAGIILAIFSALDPTTRSVTESIKADQDGQIVCPHCQVRGKVRTSPVRLKKGISGTKATGAILTGGVSLIATGLSRKEDATEARCSNCGSVWHF